jgi:hypothetical protein
MNAFRSRAVAQYELVRAVRRIFPEPLIELRTLAADEPPDVKALDVTPKIGFTAHFRSLEMSHDPVRAVRP